MVSRAYIKLTKKNATDEDLEKIKKLLDEAGVKYYIARDIEP